MFCLLSDLFNPSAEGLETVRHELNETRRWRPRYLDKEWFFIQGLGVPTANFVLEREYTGRQTSLKLNFTLRYPVLLDLDLPRLNWVPSNPNKPALLPGACRARCLHGLCGRVGGFVDDSISAEEVLLALEHFVIFSSVRL